MKRLLGRRLRGRARWVLVGGPPCQAYSLVGRSRRINDPKSAEDEKHLLYREYLKIIADHHPPVFVMENVKGLLSAKLNGTSMVNRIVADLQDPAMALSGRTDGATYRLFSLTEEERPGDEVDPRMFIVRAEDFGVPQARHRMFIVGVRNDLDIRPRRLEPAPGPSVRDMIRGLPSIRSRLSKETDTPAKWRAAIAQMDLNDVATHLNGAEYTGDVIAKLRGAIQEGVEFPKESKAIAFPPGRPSNAVSMVHDPNLHTVVGHEARSHMASDLRRYMFAAAFAEVTGRSPKLADFPISMLPAHGNVDEGVAGDTFADRFRVQLPDRVSTTVTSHISKDGHYFIHYDPMQCRSLTVREAAAYRRRTTTGSSAIGRLSTIRWATPCRPIWRPRSPTSSRPRQERTIPDGRCPVPGAEAGTCRIRGKDASGSLRSLPIGQDTDSVFMTGAFRGTPISCSRNIARQSSSTAASGIGIPGARNATHRRPGGRSGRRSSRPRSSAMRARPPSFAISGGTSSRSGSASCRRSRKQFLPI